MSLLACSDASKCLAIACLEAILIAHETSDEAASSHEETACTEGAAVSSAVAPPPRLTLLSASSVTCVAFSPSGRLVAACTDAKIMKIWNIESGTVISERELPKRATAVLFTADEDWVVVADKTGEVLRYPTDGMAAGVHLLGHFSIILDMVLSPSNRHVITCDRDEKIRISRFPNSYNIETFCLGHTDFVSKLCLCSPWSQYLLSASGDGTLRVWEWQSGTLLDTHTLSHPSHPSHPSHSVRDGAAGPQAVTGVSCTRHSEPCVVVASMEQLPALSVFLLTPEGKLVPCPEANIRLPRQPLSFAFDWSDRLWVCLTGNQNQPIICYEWTANQFKENATSPLLHHLCSSEPLQSTSHSLQAPRDWKEMRKSVIDNMAAYRFRKEERIKHKLQQAKRPASHIAEEEEEEEEGRERMVLHSEEGDGSGAGERWCELACQPAKLVKLDTSSDHS